MIELRHLRYFVAIAESMSFRAAAERLHISQPPLSRQMKQLERELGTALFERHGRRIQLTEAGSRFLGDAMAVLDGIAQARETALQIGSGSRGRIRLGFVSTALYGILPNVVRALQRRHKDIELVLRELTLPAQLRALDRGEIDAGIVIEPPSLDGLESLDLYLEPLVLCLPDRHALAATPPRRPIAARALAGETFISFPRELAPGLHDRIVEYAARAGFDLTLGQQAVQMQTIVGLVSVGLGVAIVPESLRSLSRPGIVYRELRPRTKAVRTVLIWHDERRSPALGKVIEFVSNFARKE